MSARASRPGVKRTGPKRSDESHRAIIDAAEYYLGTDGYVDFSIEKVATKAGVGKQTIYKWWGTKAGLVVEVLRDRLLPPMQPFDGTKNIRDHLKATLLEFGQTLVRTDCSQAVICLVAEMHRDRDILVLTRNTIFYPRLKVVHQSLELAIELGQIAAGANTKVCADELYGAVWYKAVIKSEPINARFINALVDQVFKGLSADR